MDVKSDTLIGGQTGEVGITGLSSENKVTFSSISDAANWVSDRVGASGAPAGLSAASCYSEMACNAVLLYPNLKEDQQFLAWKAAVDSQESNPPDNGDSKLVSFQPLKKEKSEDVTGDSLKGMNLPTRANMVVKQHSDALPINFAHIATGGNLYHIRNIHPFHGVLFTPVPFRGDATKRVLPIREHCNHVILLGNRGKTVANHNLLNPDLGKHGTDVRSSRKYMVTTDYDPRRCDLTCRHIKMDGEKVGHAQFEKNAAKKPSTEITPSMPVGFHEGKALMGDELAKSLGFEERQVTICPPHMSTKGDREWRAEAASRKMVNPFLKLFPARYALPLPRHGVQGISFNEYLTKVVVAEELDPDKQRDSIEISEDGATTAAEVETPVDVGNAESMEDWTAVSMKKRRNSSVQDRRSSLNYNPSNKFTILEQDADGLPLEGVKEEEMEKIPRGTGGAWKWNPISLFSQGVACLRSLVGILFKEEIATTIPEKEDEDKSVALKKSNRTELDEISVNNKKQGKDSTSKEWKDTQRFLKKQSKKSPVVTKVQGSVMELCSILQKGSSCSEFRMEEDEKEEIARRRRAQRRKMMQRGSRRHRRRAAAHRRAKSSLFRQVKQHQLAEKKMDVPELAKDKPNPLLSAHEKGPTRSAVFNQKDVAKAQRFSFYRNTAWTFRGANKGGGPVSGAGNWEGYSSNPQDKIPIPIGKPTTQWQPLESDRDYFDREHAIYKEETAATVIQSWWRMIRQKLLYKQYKEALRRVVKVQAVVRGFVARSTYPRKLLAAQKLRATLNLQNWFQMLLQRKKYREDVKKVIKIQSAFRGMLQRQKFLLMKAAATGIQGEEIEIEEDTLKRDKMNKLADPVSMSADEKELRRAAKEHRQEKMDQELAQTLAMRAQNLKRYRLGKRPPWFSPEFKKTFKRLCGWSRQYGGLKAGNEDSLQQPSPKVVPQTDSQGQSSGHVQYLNPATMSCKELRDLLSAHGISMPMKTGKERLVEKYWQQLFIQALDLMEKNPAQLEKTMTDLGIDCPKRTDRRRTVFTNFFKKSSAGIKNRIIAYLYDLPTNNDALKSETKDTEEFQDKSSSSQYVSAPESQSSEASANQAQNDINANLYRHPSKEATLDAAETAEETRQDRSYSSQYVSAPETQSSVTAHGSDESNVYITPPLSSPPYFSCSTGQEASTPATDFTSGAEDSFFDLRSPRSKRRRTQFPESSPLDTSMDLRAHPTEADPPSQICDNDILFDAPPFDPSAIFEGEPDPEDNAGAEEEDDENEHVEAMDVDEDNDPASPLSQADSNSEAFNVWLAAVRQNDRTIDTPQLGLLTFPEVRELSETLGVTLPQRQKAKYNQYFNAVANTLLKRYMTDLPLSFVDHLLETYKLKAQTAYDRRPGQVIGEFKRSSAPVKTEILNHIVKHWRDAAAAPTTAPGGQQTARGVRERALPTPCQPVSAPKVKLDTADLKTVEESCMILQQLRKQRLAQQLGKYKVLPTEEADREEAQPAEMLPDSWGTLGDIDNIFSILSQPSQDEHDDDHNIGSQASSHQVISFFHSHSFNYNAFMFPRCLSIRK